MRIVFQGDDNSQVMWNISMIDDDEEKTAMKWLKKNKAYAEGLTSTVQLTRLMMKAIDDTSDKTV